MILNFFIYTFQEHGLSPRVLNWTHSIFTGYSQTVVLEDEKSIEALVTSGVPQRSVLRPICFFIYINQLPSTVTS